MSGSDSVFYIGSFLVPKKKNPQQPACVAVHITTQEQVKSNRLRSQPPVGHTLTDLLDNTTSLMTTSSDYGLHMYGLVIAFQWIANHTQRPEQPRYVEIHSTIPSVVGEIDKWIYPFAHDIVVIEQMRAMGEQRLFEPVLPSTQTNRGLVMDVIRSLSDLIRLRFIGEVKGVSVNTKNRQKPELRYIEFLNQHCKDLVISLDQTPEVEDNKQINTPVVNQK